MGKGSEEDIHVIFVTNGFAHGGKLFMHISHVLKMSVYTVVLPASGIPEPPYEIRSQAMHLLLVDPLERCPGPLDCLLAFDVGESGAKAAGSMLGPMTCLITVSSFFQCSGASRPPTLPSEVYDVGMVSSAM